MKETFVNKDLSITVRDVPVPKPKKNEVLVKVVVFGTNPKDWKVPAWFQPGNSGDDIAGVVEAIGEDVFEFQKGDRVAGFHDRHNPHGAFAEYAILAAHTTFRIPSTTSFEEAATIPLATLTAATALYYALELPSPWQQKKDQEPRKIPLVINGASSAVGAYAIKLALASNIHPIIAIGSSTSKFVTQDLDSSKGDTFVDYTAHKTPESLTEAIKEAISKSGAPNGRAFHAVDAISENGSFETIGKALTGPSAETNPQRPKISVVLPQEKYTAADNTVDGIWTTCTISHADGGFPGQTFSSVWSSLFGKGLQQGWLKPHPHEVIPNGLKGLDKALKDLSEGKVRAKKLVGRVADTPGLA